MRTKSSLLAWVALALSLAAPLRALPGFPTADLLSSLGRTSSPETSLTGALQHSAHDAPSPIKDWLSLGLGPSSSHAVAPAAHSDHHLSLSLGQSSSSDHDAVEALLALKGKAPLLHEPPSADLVRSASSSHQSVTHSGTAQHTSSSTQVAAIESSGEAALAAARLSSKDASHASSSHAPLLASAVATPDEIRQAHSTLPRILQAGIDLGHPHGADLAHFLTSKEALAASERWRRGILSRESRPPPSVPHTRSTAEELARRFNLDPKVTFSAREFTRFGQIEGRIGRAITRGQLPPDALGALNKPLTVNQLRRLRATQGELSSLDIERASINLDHPHGPAVVKHLTNERVLATSAARRKTAETKRARGTFVPNRRSTAEELARRFGVDEKLAYSRSDQNDFRNAQRKIQRAVDRHELHPDALSVLQRPPTVTQLARQNKTREELEEIDKRNEMRRRQDGEKRRRQKLEKGESTDLTFGSGSSHLV